MTSKEKDEFSRLLEIFDRQELNDIHGRRTAYRPLYDYFLKLVTDIATTFCDLRKETLQSSQLYGRWDAIQNCLSLIDNPNTWDKLIREINDIRNKVEHKDDYDPKEESLKEIRAQVIKFEEWISRVAKEYYKKSKAFTVKEYFYIISSNYITRAESIIHEYGEKPPFIAENYSSEFEVFPYQQLPELIKTLHERLKKIATLEDIERTDLEKLIQLVKIVNKLKGREEVLTHFPVCPKCGGEIKETHENLGGNTEEQPEPYGVYIRVGCQKCDYLIHDETIDL